MRSDWARSRYAFALVAMLVLAACTGRQSGAPVQGELKYGATPPQVPLRDGLTLVEAHHYTSGDYEPITTVDHVDAAGVTITTSTDEPSAACDAHTRSFGLRRILREDLEDAHALRQEFEACPSVPELHPGSTGISVSASVLRELNANGQTNLNATTRVAGMVPGVLTRVGRGTVPFSIIVNDEPVELRAVHARWQSSVGAREYWILDDVANPLVLRASYKGAPILEVVKLSYPAERTTAASRIARDLSKDGRASIYGIYFDFGSDGIKDESEANLAEIAKVLQQNPSWSLAVEGHTDNIGSDGYNLDLSKRRAAAVRQALVWRYQIDGKRLQANGYGASRPKDTNETLEGRARNRRVELVKVG